MDCRSDQIKRLVEQLQAIEQRSAGGSTPPRKPIATGWANVDQTTGGLAAGALHEWFGVGSSGAIPKEAWRPPLQILTHLASRAFDAGSDGYVVWIGRRCWPHGQLLVLPRLLERSIFVDDESPSRLWAIDLALRCPAVAAVVADGSGLTMSATRRLQLASSAGSAVGLVARPYHEIETLSAAATRWVVKNLPTDSNNPRWSVELLRCKGVQPAPRAPRQWVLEGEHVTGAVTLFTNVADRSGAAAIPASEPGRFSKKTA